MMITRFYWIISANTSMFTYGLQCGWIAVFAKSLQSEQSPTGFALSDSEISWLASAPSLSATITVGIYTYLADKYGRRKCIILVALFQAVSIMQVYVQMLYYFISYTKISILLYTVNTFFYKEQLLSYITVQYVTGNSDASDNLKHKYLTLMVIDHHYIN